MNIVSIKEYSATEDYLIIVLENGKTISYEYNFIGDDLYLNDLKFKK